MLGEFGKSASWRGGVYENEYALDKGVWKISKVQYYLQYSGAYEEYGHKAPAEVGHSVPLRGGARRCDDSRERTQCPLCGAVRHEGRRPPRERFSSGWR